MQSFNSYHSETAVNILNGSVHYSYFQNFRPHVPRHIRPLCSWIFNVFISSTIIESVNSYHSEPVNIERIVEWSTHFQSYRKIVIPGIPPYIGPLCSGIVKVFMSFPIMQSFNSYHSKTANIERLVEWSVPFTSYRENCIPGVQRYIRPLCSGIFNIFISSTIMQSFNSYHSETAKLHPGVNVRF
jgi:hypothetical protein